MTQAKETSIKGQRIAYYESTGQGLPVVCIHGNSLSGLSFDKQLAGPLGEQYRLIALDLPGHGRSLPLLDPASCTLPGYAAHLVAFTKALALKESVFVGWSLGGHILLEAAAHLPQALGFLLFGAPPVGRPIAAEAFLPNPLFNLLYRRGLSAEEATELLSAFFMEGCPLPPAFHADLLRADNRLREGLGKSIAAGEYADEVVVAAGCGKPLAVLHGEYDRLVNRAYLQTLAIPTLWRGAVQIIAQAGHSPHWEQPEQFDRLLHAFIEDLRLAPHSVGVSDHRAPHRAHAQPTLA